MNTLLTDAQIQALSTLYNMGNVWGTATDAERILAVRTVESSWKVLPWITSPFDNTATAAELRYVLVRAAIHVLENEGSQGTETDEIVNLLRPYLASKQALSMGLVGGAASVSSTGATLTGSQIVLLLDSALGVRDGRLAEPVLLQGRT